MYSATSTPSMKNDVAITLNNDLKDIRAAIVWSFQRECLKLFGK